MINYYNLKLPIARFVKDFGLSTNNDTMDIETPSVMRKHKVDKFSFVSPSIHCQNDEIEIIDIRTLR